MWNYKKTRDRYVFCFQDMYLRKSLKLFFEIRSFQYDLYWQNEISFSLLFFIVIESEASNCQGTKSSKCWGLLPKTQLFHNWGLKSAVLIEGRLLFKSKGQSVLVKKHDFSWKRVLLDLALSLIRTDCMLRLSHVHKGLRDSLRVGTGYIK